MLLIVNLFLLYALFFAGLGQSTQITSNIPRETSHAISNLGQNSQLKNLNFLEAKEPGLPGLNVWPEEFKTETPQTIGYFPNHFLRSASLPTPLMNVEPLSWLIVLSFLFSAVLFLNNPVCLFTGVILTNSYICDTYACFFKVLVCLASAASLTLTIPWYVAGTRTTGQRISNYEFLLVIYLSVLGMLCLISSYNFLTFYLSIELQSLSFYLLACSRSRSEFSAEAGLKYFILGAFSSAILVFGISLIYGSSGSINFDDIAALLEFHGSPNSSDLQNNFQLEAILDGYTPLRGVVLGLACVCISLLFKLAAAPFHMWAPDVYEGSPMSITGFFAITAKIAALAVLARFVIMTDMLLIPFLSFVTVISLILGTLGAMRQVKIKRLIAFSGVSNVGWFLLGLSCGGLDAVILHLMVYVVLSVTLFSIFIQPIHRYAGPHDYGMDYIKHISDLSQLYKTNTNVAFALNLAFFSLGGIPVLAGFYSKYLIINASIQTGSFGLLFVGLVSAVLSAFYYIRVVKTIYFTEAPGKTMFFNSGKFSFSVPSPWNAYMIGITSFLTCFLIIYPEFLAIWSMNASL